MNPPEGAVAATSEPAADATWDAGDMGCGPLLLALRGKLRGMPGRIMKVISLDLGAPEDMPAWCRITRNTLLHHDPEARAYWIKSRDDW